MHKQRQFLCLLFILSLFTVSCSNNKTPLFKKDESNENEKKNNLFVFVGEKIEVKELSQDKDSWDGKFYAKYKVLQNIYGDYKADTIEFIVYDHYGIPSFNRYKNVMLFVSEYKGKYYHSKYQFYDVYRTKDNRWAGRYSVGDLGYDNKRNKSVSARKIDFADEVSIPLALVNSKEIGCWFPTPYYKIEKDKAVALYGNYVEDLFKIKKEGVLTARGLFGNGKPDELNVPDTEMAEISNLSREDWKKAESLWSRIIQPKDSFNIKLLTEFSLDSIYIDDTLFSIRNSRLRDFLSKKLLLSFKDSTSLLSGSYQLSDEIKRSHYFKNKASKGNDNYEFFQAETVIDTADTFEFKISAAFIKTQSMDFRLYRLKEEKKCICWQ